jgi:hypothetical protein
MLGQKIEEIKQQQKKMHEHSQASKEANTTNDKSQIIVALGGVAAGFTLAVIVWLAKSIVASHHIHMMEPDMPDVIHLADIKKLNKMVVQLNERVELLTESISNMEARLTSNMVPNDTIFNTKEKHDSSSQLNIHESSKAGSVSDINESNASTAVQVATAAQKPFIPTHTVKARLNLRPSATLNSRPIATLKVGTEVQYISQSGGWDYVNTRLHGKGWCSSDYLSPVLPTQHESSAY